MGINIFLDETSGMDLKYLQETTGLSATEIIKHSLQLYVREVKGEALSKSQQLVEELAGAWEGPEDGSVNYKKDVMDYLDEKYPDH